MGSFVLFSSIGVWSLLIEDSKLSEKMKKKKYHEHNTRENHLQCKSYQLPRFLLLFVMFENYKK